MTGLMRIRALALWLIVSIGGLLAAAGAGAQAGEPSFPALTGRVVDAAGIIPAQARTTIEARLAAHEAKTSDQIVVATVPSLQGYPIEDFANRLFRTWKLGQAKTNNGVLLLVAPNERKVRIEVGYGLEGTLTDAISRVIIATAVTPKFKTGDYAGGIEAGVDAIAATLTGDDEWQKRAAERPAAGSDIDPLTLILIFVAIYVVILLISRMQGGGPGRPHQTRRGNWIVIPSGSGGWGGGWSGGSSGGGGFSGGGGSSGGGGASGDW